MIWGMVVLFLSYLSIMVSYYYVLALEFHYYFYCKSNLSPFSFYVLLSLKCKINSRNGVKLYCIFLLAQKILKLSFKTFHILLSIFLKHIYLLSFIYIINQRTFGHMYLNMKIYCQAEPLLWKEILLSELFTAMEI